MEQDYKIVISLSEKIVCLDSIISKLKKILYVYDKSQEPNSSYNYKVYCGGVALYVSSSNMLFDGELVSIIVNLNSILNNDFDKKQIKNLVLESVNYSEFLLNSYKRQKEVKGDGNIWYYQFIRYFDVDEVEIT